jgi:hypothetical protein
MAEEELHQAVVRGDLQAVQRLAAAGADIESADEVRTRRQIASLCHSRGARDRRAGCERSF